MHVMNDNTILAISSSTSKMYGGKSNTVYSSIKPNNFYCFVHSTFLKKTKKLHIKLKISSIRCVHIIKDNSATENLRSRILVNTDAALDSRY